MLIRPHLRLAAVAGLALLSCVPQREAEPVSQKRASCGADQLRERAEQFWTARVGQEWDVVFKFQDPTIRETAAESEFIAWCETNEPFLYQLFNLDRVQTEGTIGWVEVEYTASLTRFPQAPARQTHKWEKWRVIEGQWYPVPVRRLEDYPETPAKRDATDEARLRLRHGEVWKAMQARDWHQVYELCDPRDHPDVPKGEFAEKEDLLLYRGAEIKWVEVVGDQGRVRVAYRTKLNDPSQSKLPEGTGVVTERWIKYQNEWYRDLIQR